MKQFFAISLLLLAISAYSAELQLTGQLQPKHALPVHLQGVTTPFSADVQADLNGKFRFRNLEPGTYVLAVDGMQRTVEVATGSADSKGRVNVAIDLSAADAGQKARDRDRVSARELSVPKEAFREYDEAEKALGRRDVRAAVEHLRRAVQAAPQFSTAWNLSGTLAYQARRYKEAETDFRKALYADPAAYAPLVNLGGVLLNLGEWHDALEYNRRAVLANSSDALANAQLGMAYFYSDQIEPAEKYLIIAKRIDPAHFSRPQIFLAQIYMRRNKPDAAAEELQDLLHRHPGLENASEINQQITRLREHAR